MNIIEKIYDYILENEEKVFIVKILILSFVFNKVAIIFYANPTLYTLLVLPFIAMYLIVVAYQRDLGFFKTLTSYICFMPMEYTTKETRYKDIPFVTYSIILLNFIIHYTLTDFGLDIEAYIDVCKNYCFPPTGPSFINSYLSLFTYMFLHADDSHLIYNMFFLWVIGCALEKRIGVKSFLTLYLATGIISVLIIPTIYFIFTGEIIDRSVLGASGAIFGITGVYAVRCYFRTMIFPVPIFGLIALFLPIGIKVRLSSLFVLSILFLSNVRGLSAQIFGESNSNIAYFEHLSAMFVGIIIALILKYHRQAYNERLLEEGVDEVSSNRITFKTSENIEKLLEIDPDNHEAILAQARTESMSFPTDEGKMLYEKAMRLYFKNDRDKVCDIFAEYFEQYLKIFDDHILQFNVAQLLYRKGKLELASRVLEFMANDTTTPVDLKEKCYYQFISILIDLGYNDGATTYFNNLKREYPSSDYLLKLEEKLVL